MTPDTSRAFRSSSVSNQIQPTQDLRHQQSMDASRHRAPRGAVRLHRPSAFHLSTHVCLQQAYLKAHTQEKRWNFLAIEAAGILDHDKSGDIYWIFPGRKTVEEMLQRAVCMVCSFTAVPHIPRASHSASDLCCLNPAAQHSCQTMTGGGRASCLCV